MKNIKWIFVLYAFAALLSMIGIGLAVALDSILLILLTVLLLGFIMALGFKKKKQMIASGEL